MTEVLLSAGDVSGDALAAGFARALQRRRPDCRLYGLGGAEMERAGVELVAEQRALAVGGFVELASGARGIHSTWRALSAALRDRPPRLVVLVDSGGFHLPFARQVRRLCDARILYYVAPQVWAWRRGRISKLARRVDRIAVLFPFEPAWYEGRGVPVEHVGHPLVDRLAPLRERCERAEARDLLSLPAAGPLVCLLPGSRRNEIRHQLPLQLATARALGARRPDCRFVLAVASAIRDEDLRAAGARPEALARAGVSPVRDRTPEAMRAADAVLAKPGTGTLEAALLDRPMVVMGRAHPLTALLVRRLIELPWLAMPNLIAGREIVPEFLQQEAVPARMAEALEALLEGPARDAQLRALAEVREALGPPGAAERAAALAEQMLGAAPA